MDIFEVMGTCRAIRYLKSDSIPDELIEQVITAATWAPSPGNSQGRDFVVVTDKKKIAAIATAIEQTMGERVSLMERPDRAHRLMLDGTEHLLKTLHDCPVLIFVCGKPIYPHQSPRESFVWSSIYPAAQNLILAARALGLGTVFTTFQGVAESTIREILEIPEEVLINRLLLRFKDTITTKTRPVFFCVPVNSLSGGQGISIRIILGKKKPAIFSG